MPERFHLTVAFLGMVDENRLDDVSAAVLIPSDQKSRATPPIKAAACKARARIAVDQDQSSPDCLMKF